MSGVLVHGRQMQAFAQMFNFIERSAAIGPGFLDTWSVDYDLVRLGPHEFEHLVQALCAAAFGARVEPFGAGPDGGRDAAIRGRIDWDDGEEGTPLTRWDGYTIIQAKFRLRPNDPGANLSWLLNEMQKELSSWSIRLQKEAENRRTEIARRQRQAEELEAKANHLRSSGDHWRSVEADRLQAQAKQLKDEVGHLELSAQEPGPDYLLIVTNVVLSPGRNAGVDTAHKRIAEMVDKFKPGFRAWRLWHYDNVRTLLDVHRSVRITYGGFLNSGDILARMDEWLGREQTNFGDALTIHTTKELLAQRYVRLGQAGDLAEDKLALDEIGIDLPAQIGTLSIIQNSRGGARFGLSITS